MDQATNRFPLDEADALPLAIAPAAPRMSAAKMVADALRTAIVEGTLAPGAPLRQDAVARHFSVSAIPVREALRQLESEGWAKVELNKGATVAPLLADEAREIYEIRASLESLAVSLAIPAHTEATLRVAQSLCDAARNEPDPALYVARNEAFHMSLYAPAARPQLMELITTLHRRGERYLRVKFGLPDRKDVSDREHAAILRAVRRGEVATAQKLLTEHLLDTGELLYRMLAEGSSDAGRTGAKRARERRAASASHSKKA